MELRPTNKSTPKFQSGQTAQKRWTLVFKALAKLNEEEEIGLNSALANASISLKDLKSYLQSESSYKVKVVCTYFGRHLTQSFFQLERDTGFARHQLVYLASQLANYADKNKDGKISLKEWQEWLDSKKRPFAKSRAMGGFMQVVAYSPTYSCCPPTVFILGITFLIVLFYVLW